MVIRRAGLESSILSSTAKSNMAFRANDIERGRLRVDEALKQAERGAAFIGEPKTPDSYGYVSLPAKFEVELRSWVRDMGIPPEGWLFPASRGGGPIRPNNFVKRDLAKLAKAAGVGAIDLRAPAPDLRNLPAGRGRGAWPTPSFQRGNHQAALHEGHRGRTEGARGASRPRDV